MKLYVASSWREERQPVVVEALRRAGHEVYDFRHPSDENHGFHWSEIDPMWQSWTPTEYRDHLLNHPIAADGLCRDVEAMKWADGAILVVPKTPGRSAHLELGWFIGAGKPTYILLRDGEPELMYGMATSICVTIEEVVEEVGRGF